MLARLASEIPTAAIEPNPVEASPDRNPAMLSMRLIRKETCFGWTVYSPTNELLGHGTAETEHKARIDAFQAGMTYINRLKGRSVPKDSALH